MQNLEPNTIPGIGSRTAQGQRHRTGGAATYDRGRSSYLSVLGLMPIRINLLAEAKLAEEQRRKDPVKRATFAAAFLVSLVVLWTTTLQFKIIAAGSDLNRLEARW